MFFIIAEYIKNLNLLNKVIHLAPITPLIDIDLEEDRHSYRITIPGRFSTQEEVDALV